MSLYLVVKIIHLMGAIFFISVVGFRTVILPVLKKEFDENTYLKINKLTGKRARTIIKINNLFLILSGSYLLSLRWDHATTVVYFKVTLGLLLAVTFYFVPYIMEWQKNRKGFSEVFHYLFFTSMLIVVILSQLL